jgi:hypothetical protein
MPRRQTYIGSNAISSDTEQSIIQLLPSNVRHPVPSYARSWPKCMTTEYALEYSALADS